MGLDSAAQPEALSYWNAVAEAGLIAVFAAIIAVFRNWAVHGPAFHLRFAFIGGDLLIGFVGIGVLLFVRMIFEELTQQSPDVYRLALGACSIFVAALPLFAASVLTERRIHGPPFQRRLGALGVNLVAGALPLSCAVFVISLTIGGLKLC